MSIEQAAINLAVAFFLSAVIGFERQWRNRLAGLRTNTLVALGAASFVVFEALVPEGASPTRVAAQVVSGIGFLGAGLIFREGMSVRGLNTAATLWCSAAVGVLAGAGYLAYAALATGFIVFVNLLLRPIVNFINRQPLVSSEVETGYLIALTCRAEDEAQVRALLLQGLAGSAVALRGLDSNDLNGTSRVRVTAHLMALHRMDAEVEKIVGRISLEPTITAARWEAHAQLDPESRSALGH
jgi:putative Mg2+ transporter-C (MgtC) family protein